jgi:hypothetical protein
VYVIDSADRKRIDECGVELAQLLEVRPGTAARDRRGHSQDALTNVQPGLEAAVSLFANLAAAVGRAEHQAAAPGDRSCNSMEYC